MDRCNKGVLERLCPEVIQKGIGHIDLTDLHHAHGDDARENESPRVQIQLKENRQQPHRKETDHRPEEDFKESEETPFRDDPVLEDEGPDLNQVLGQIHRDILLSTLPWPLVRRRGQSDGTATEKS